MRDERIEGGIFMVSNVSDSTAVWNCRVHDKDGSIIGPHGNIERLRPLLGPPSKLLEAGELVWMTDKTPHESKPVLTSVHRQYFRLVIGEVTAWYADHSTANPLGITPPSTTRIVYGNKFDLYSNRVPRRCLWSVGTPSDIMAAGKVAKMRMLLYEFGIGHLMGRLEKCGIRSTEQLAGMQQWGTHQKAVDGQPFFLEQSYYYYDSKQFEALLMYIVGA